MTEYKVVVDGRVTKWYKPGTSDLHRVDGPACEYVNGSRAWWLNGDRHRADGPAIARADGYKAWFLDGVPMSEIRFLEKTQPTAKELTVSQLQEMLGFKIKVIEG